MVRMTRTLRLYGTGGVDDLDPVAAHHPAAAQLTRLYARQLFTYAAERDLRDWRAVAPVPDLALAVPSTYNAGVGASHRSYVVHLRPGVLWDTAPGRPLTAHDVVRGIKRMANPVLRPPGLVYFTSTIRGMAEYCDQYAASVPAANPSAAALKEFQDANDIPGVFALDDSTVVFELFRPAVDFIDILALPCAAPAPEEYDKFIPGSPQLRANLRSNGPYRLVDADPGRRLLFGPNPAWRQDTDPVRGRHAEHIEVTVTPEAADAADLPFGPAVARREPPGPGDDLGWMLDPYLVVNLRSPNAGGAMRDPVVRRAIGVAIDRTALRDLVAEFDPGSLARAADGVVPPGNDGYAEGIDDAGCAGDPERARRLLREAGYEDDVDLVAPHADTDRDARIARRYAADLERAGFRVRLVALPGADYHRLLADPARGSAGEWDIAAASRSPDWYHGNGRVFLQPMFHSGPTGGTANWGGYRDAEVDALINRALGASVPAQANRIWQEVQQRVLADAAVIPLVFRKPGGYPLGSRVCDAISLPTLGSAPDLSLVRLAPAA
ncbi:ABC transporter substrate-binding protein [Micromonospora sp. NPDC003776]